jgi:5-methylcytosine-specific restriction protein A
MPQRAKRPCEQSGCPALVESGYCEVHAKPAAQQHERWRGSAASRGYDSAWQRLAAAHKRKHPLCVDCLKQGRVTAVEEVDHVIPFKGKDDPLRLDPKNLQSLCGSHHRAKTAQQRALKESRERQTQTAAGTLPPMQVPAHFADTDREDVSRLLDRPPKNHN